MFALVFCHAPLLFRSNCQNDAMAAEEDKKFFEETLGKNSKALDEFNRSLHDTSAKLECAEQNIMSGWSVSSHFTCSANLVECRLLFNSVPGSAYVLGYLHLLYCCLHHQDPNVFCSSTPIYMICL
jgi:hypothetical protein